MGMLSRNVALHWQRQDDYLLKIIDKGDSISLNI